MTFFKYKKIKNILLFFRVLPLALLFFSNSAFSLENAIEYKIKAAYLYNFTKFIVWPENQLDTFNLCVLGDDPFGTIIDAIESRSVNGKAIKIYRLQTVSEASHCHIVYFGQAKKQWNVADISSQHSVLSVGESDSFTNDGGMIAFVFKDGKIKLQININSLRQSALEVSAQLLEVAEIVHGVSDE